ncbi:MAG: hypothetical protein LQ342_007187 [Letrouitia transgressa]|nr:MAG: hypothetical protein LQ342_007187 [Letrouitia transgressa]
MVERKAGHAGSWYTNHARTLSSQLSTWLFDVPNPLDDIGPLPIPGCRIIIAPHAGYSYSGPTAAWAYMCLDLSNCKRIFLLGPSHHIHLPTVAALPPDTTAYLTPLGPLPLDTDLISSLLNDHHKLFSPLDPSDDEKEHSLEMHLPYIRHLVSLRKVKGEEPLLVPLMIGSTSEATECRLGKLLAPFLADPENVFVVSSDFAHWGRQFGYMYYLPDEAAEPGRGVKLSSAGESSSLLKKGTAVGWPIHESIRKVDGYCMRAVESGEHQRFVGALQETGNTVCGRHPITVAMAALEVVREQRGESTEGEVGESQRGQGNGRFRFVRYQRSGMVQGIVDSSVSYASAFAVL